MLVSVEMYTNYLYHIGPVDLIGRNMTSNNITSNKWGFILAVVHTFNRSAYNTLRNLNWNLNIKLVITILKFSRHFLIGTQCESRICIETHLS